MRKKAVLLFLAVPIDALILLLFITSLAEFQSPIQRYDFSLLREGSGGVCVCDINTDGKDDILQLDLEGPFPGQKILRLFSPFIPAPSLKYKFFFEIPVPANLGFAAPTDIEGRGRPVIPMISMSKDETILRQFDSNGNEISMMDFPPFYPPINSGTGIDQVEFEDLNGDGWREMILVINSSYSKLPRGLVAYDVRGRQKLWQYPCGCSPLVVKVVDINRDGNKEIIMSGWSPHNGAAANGTDDDHSYLILLSSAGKEIKKVVLGGYYTRVFFDVFDVDEDGSLEIITSKGCHRAILSPEPGEIRILNGSTLETRKYIQDGEVGFSDLYLTKNSENKSICIVGDSKGRVSVFDKDIKLRSRVFLESPAIVRGVFRLGSFSREPRILIQAGFKDLVILDLRLNKIQEQVLKEYSENIELKAFQLRDGPRDTVLLSMGQLFLAEEKAGLFSGFFRYVISPTAAFFALFILFNGFLFITRKYLRNSTAPAERGGDGNWAEVAQEIVHRMKSSLFTLQLEGERLKTVPVGENQEAFTAEMAKISGSILEDIADLKLKIRTVMKLLEMRHPEFRKTDMSKVVEQTVNHYRELLKGKIEFSVDLDKDAAHMDLDENLIREALSNLIENSIDALPKGGRIDLALTVIYSPIFKTKKAVEIEVEDNGIGIPASRLADIFKPYFSTKKEGAGIGLPIARRIVEAHGGRIEVQSKEGVGTRIAIILPWKG